MIRSLKLENFRRHENTYLDFSSDAQIVAITGRNGAGKSTVLEAILFALYGETRHGRRGMAGLVRRGAEHEGMGVTCEFTVAGTLYRVERRLDKGKHSAALYANNNLHTQTADGVTQAITGLLGMDAVGFRLATIAKQKELDGLAEMTPAVRRKTIARLLRLDAVQAAVLQARDQHKSAKHSADALAGTASVQVRQQELAAVEAELGEAQTAYNDAQAVVTELDAKIGAASDVESLYHQAQVAESNAKVAWTAAQDELSRIELEEQSHEVPSPVVAPDMSPAQIAAELETVGETISRGREQRTLGNQISSLQSRHREAAAEVESLEPRLVELSARDLDAEKAELAAARTEAEQRRDTASDELEQVLARGAESRARLDDLNGRLTKNHELGDACDACGQDVPESHKEQQRHDLQARADVLSEQVSALRERSIELREAMQSASVALKELDKQQSALRAAVTERDNLTGLLEGARRRAEAYNEELTRLEERVQPVDLDEAYARKTELEALKVESENATYAQVVRDAAVKKAEDLAAAVSQAKQRLENAANAAAAAQVPSDVEAAWMEQQQLKQAREGERKMVEALMDHLADARARHAAAQTAVSEAEHTQSRVDEFRTKAEVAAKSATVLDAVARRLATQLRPQLEGQISALLQLMSEGRFTTVRVSDEYEVTVRDHDGRFYPVNEFSGGEADLIALAIRLALAQVVTARHGAGGAGFIILDECFGSQDAGRRFAILEALRRLRSTFGQVLLISHIPGIEDAADTVLSVEKDDEEEVARVMVLA